MRQVHGGRRLKACHCMHDLGSGGFEEGRSSLRWIATVVMFDSWPWSWAGGGTGQGIRTAIGIELLDRIEKERQIGSENEKLGLLIRIRTSDKPVMKTRYDSEKRPTSIDPTATRYNYSFGRPNWIANLDIDMQGSSDIFTS